jgi:hypothetical protein
MEEMDTLKSDLNKNQSKCEKLEVDVDTVMVECEKKIKELEVRTIAREIEAKDNEEIRSRWMRDVYAEITDLRIEMKTNCKEVADLKIKSNAQSERRIENINVEDERNTRRNSRSSISLLRKGRNKKLKIDDESSRESDEDYTSDDDMRHTHRCKERSHRNTVKDNIEDESTSEGSSSHSCKHCSRRSEASSGERRNKRSCKSKQKVCTESSEEEDDEKNGRDIRMRLSEIKSFTQYPSTGEEMSAKTFLEQFEDEAKVIGIQRNQYMKVIPFLLHGTVKSWFRSNRKRMKTYQAFTTRFMEYHQSEEYTYSRLNRLKTTPFNPKVDNNVEQFVNDRYQMMRDLDPTMSETQACHGIISLLPLAYQHHLATVHTD